MNYLFFIIVSCGIVIATYHLSKVKEDRKKVFSFCLFLGFILIIVGAILSIIIYDFETTIDLLLIKKWKVWGRFIFVGYGLIISSLAALIIGSFKRKEIKN